MIGSATIRNRATASPPPVVQGCMASEAEVRETTANLVLSEMRRCTIEIYVAVNK